MTVTGEPQATGVSDKSRGVALARATVLGVFGGHRFYVGKVRSGVVMAVTLGGAGLWWLYDLILIGAGSFRDADGRLVRRWEPEGVEGTAAIGSEVLDELDLLRQQVADLAERVDFAERLLANPRGAPEAHPPD
jgi:hypothetical protein